ncbi:hypothetical protein ACNOYE_37135 [Nannocystaceae bacterium ST9]
MSPDWKCPNVGRCELFPVLRSEQRLRVCLDRYCLDDYSSCARYQHVKATGNRPPVELLPTGERLADPR